MPIRRVQCDNWFDFKEHVFSELYGPQIPFRRGLFWFRGQSDARWSLVSSFDRWFSKQALAEELRPQRAEQFRSAFKAYLDEFRGTSATSETEEMLLALGQHYGLPTRLLDWSESPYIAAFFAFIELEAQSDTSQDRPEDVAVWALDTQSYLWRDRGVRLVRIADEQNHRLRSQEGVFTLSEMSFDSLEEYVTSQEKRPKALSNATYPLVRFEIPVGQAQIALADLDSMGIDAVRIKGDVEGCTLAAKLHVRIINSVSAQTNGSV